MKTVGSLSCLALAIMAFASTAVSAATISGGAATFTLKKDNPGIQGIWKFDALFDGNAPYNQIINWNYDTNSQNYPGNASFGTTTIAGVEHVVFGDPIRPHGVTPTPVSGRAPQSTTLEFDPSVFSPASFLSAWSTSTVSGFNVGTQGEQIGFTNMTRWTPYNSTGSLVNGDFALRYAPSRIGGSKSGLVLASYAAGFNSTLFADLANVSITFDGSSKSLSIVGDLLLGEGVSFWDAGATTGANIGTFSMTATVVPEPTTALLGLGASLLCGTVRMSKARTRRQRS